MPTVLKSRSLNLLETSGPVQACNGIALTVLRSNRLDVVKALRYKPTGRGFDSRWCN